MSLEPARRIITSRFLAEWADRTEVALPLQTFAADRDDLDEWVRLSILPGDGFTATIGAPGANLRRDAGVVVLNIFVRSTEHGLKRLAEHRDFAGPIFRNWRSGSLLFRTDGAAAPAEDSPWSMIAVRWPFQIDTFDA